MDLKLSEEVQANLKRAEVSIETARKLISEGLWDHQRAKLFFNASSIFSI